MLKQQIESWAHQVIDRVINGQPNEDSLAELKSEWPADLPRAAKRLAGHANAARNQTILWIIGVDENARMVTGAQHEQFADWMARITSCFDDAVTPSPTEINIAHSGMTVVAIAFTTDRAPYVIKNPAGGAQQRDVPFREGTRTDSITRRQLLGVLLPSLAIPKIEPIVIEASVYGMKDKTLEVQVDQTFALEQPYGNTSTILLHCCEVRIEYAGVTATPPLRELQFQEEKNLNVDANAEVMTCQGSGYFRLKCINYFPITERVSGELEGHTLPLTVKTRFETANDRHIIEIAGAAQPAESSDGSNRWVLNRWPNIRPNAPQDYFLQMG